MKRSRKKKLGLPPGSLVSTGVNKIRARVRICRYDEGSCSDQNYIENLSASNAWTDVPGKNTWIEVNGYEDIETIEQLGRIFTLSPLLLEDVVSSDQRVKSEDLGDSLFTVVRLIRYSQEKKIMDSEQISIILHGNTVISFSQTPEDQYFQPVRERIQNARGRIRSKDSNYLLYALLDFVVDNYFVVLEDIEDQIDELEFAVARSGADQTMLKSIHRLLKDLMFLKRWIWPMREVVKTFERHVQADAGSELVPFLRDLYDHVVRIVESIEMSKGILTGLLDFSISTMSHKLNEVMKVLTMISTIFMPLSFIAALYGMNFRYMPELQSPIAYPIVLGVMVIISAGMLLFFKRKKWF